MNVANDLGRAVGDGITGLVAGSFRALGAAVQAVINTFQTILPGIWLPIAGVLLIVFVLWLFKK